MMPMGNTLADQKSGFRGQVTKVLGESVWVNRLEEIGLIPGQRIVLLSKLSLGEPYIVEYRNISVALRREEAACLTVQEQIVEKEKN